MHPFRRSLVLALLTMASTALLAASPLGGEWGGDQVRLTLDATGGRIEYGCGAGTKRLQGYAPAIAGPFTWAGGGVRTAWFDNTPA